MICVVIQGLRVSELAGLRVNRANSVRPGEDVFDNLCNRVL